MQYFPVVNELNDKAKAENLAYVSADKGSKTVIMDKTDYIQMMHAYFKTSAIFVKKAQPVRVKNYMQMLGLFLECYVCYNSFVYFAFCT